MIENNQRKSKESKAAGRGGARKGAGRKAGGATKRTRQIADKAAEEGLTPLEYMLQVMRTEPTGEMDMREMIQATTLRFEAAKAAAPYMHPRLAAIEHTGADGAPMLPTVINLVRSGE